MRRRTPILLIVLLSFCVGAYAQGGPPFRTDDPETPGNRHWEINFGFVGDSNPALGAYQVPDFDINYGLGDRIQLKYELPIAISQQKYVPPGAFQDGAAGPVSPYVLGGLGNSLLGVKWRFYEHHPGDRWLGRNVTVKEADGPERLVDFSVSTYPQLSLNNPTRSVARTVVPSGPDFFLPLEANARVGPIRLDAEFGYHFGNEHLAQSWIRGLLVGHEFTERTEAYVEIYDQQDANRVVADPFNFPGVRGPKQRESTLGLGGRQALNQTKTLNLLLMGGRSFQTASGADGQPSWIAYVGLQVLLGPKEPETPQVEQKLPNEGK